MSLMKQFTNKKFVIVAHSMGNLKTSYTLWNMPQQEKDDLIQLYVSLGPPLLGAAKPISYLTCGSNEFSFFFHIGIDMKTWKRMAGTYASVFELLPPPTFLSQASQPWMQKIMARIDYEQGKTTDPVFDFLPTIDQQCFKNFNQTKCILGFENYDNFASFLGERVTNKNLQEWMTNYTFSNYSSQFYNMMDKRFETLPNINVPTVVLYTSVVPTEGKYVFNTDPRRRSSQDQFCGKDDQFWHPWQGDDTVPSISSLTPAMKWAQEFASKAPDAKPIKLVNICSTYNVKGSPYDGSANGRLVMDKLEFQGLPCDCSEGKYRHCTHLGMMYNPAIAEYVATSLISHDVQPVSEMVQKMTEAQLEAFWNSCQILQATLDKEDRQEEVKMTTE